MKHLLIAGVHVIFSIITLLIAFVIASTQRLRNGTKARPAVLFGTTPIINIKYWSQSLRKMGYRSVSFAYGVYSINTKDDYDYLPEKIFPWLSRFSAFRLMQYYLCFLWGLLKFDIFVLDFDGGFLKSTPLQFLEFPFYTLARKKIIAIPYGSDVEDLRRCRDAITQAAILQDYPRLGANVHDIERRVLHYSHWASFIVCGGIMVDFLPRFDLLVTSPLAIDVKEWQTNCIFTVNKSPSFDNPIKILHAPNHRHIKGTKFLIQACEELRNEGLPIKLIVKERVPNTEIKRIMSEVDIIASAFVMGFYELFAIEGMSMSKPVLNYWRPDLKFIYATYSYASECPIVDTPIDKIKENIEVLVKNPNLRLQLGEAGRHYVEKYHSYEAIGQLFDKVIRTVWFGEKVEFFPASSASYPSYQKSG